MQKPIKKGPKVITVIPARMGSSRFPGKPLADILGKPMIQHVYEQCCKSVNVDKTVVATCDVEIYDFVRSIGGDAVMTANTHERASDRCAEAVEKIERHCGGSFDFVVMVQGDEPMVCPEMIDEALSPLLINNEVQVSNLVGRITSEELENPNIIKVVTNRHGNALYMTRKPIPANVEQQGLGVCGKQVCVIPFTRQFLKTYTELSPTPLEVSESIDMLRVLEHGFAVRMVPTKFNSQPVDTAQDLLKVIELMNVDERYQ